MVSKCANPSCSASFRYWHEGKLFRVEIGSPQGKTAFGASRAYPRSEFFWLCQRCATEMTLEYRPKDGIVLKPRGPDLRAAS